MSILSCALRKEGLPLPVEEYKFSPDRNWRFDYAFPEFKIAIEQEGGIFTGGRHVRGAGYLKDMEKYNQAAILGWRILRYTPEQLVSNSIEDLKKMLKT